MGDDAIKFAMDTVKRTMASNSMNPIVEEGEDEEIKDAVKYAPDNVQDLSPTNGLDVVRENEDKVLPEKIQNIFDFSNCSNNEIKTLTNKELVASDLSLPTQQSKEEGQRASNH